MEYIEFCGKGEEKEKDKITRLLTALNIQHNLYSYFSDYNQKILTIMIAVNSGILGAMFLMSNYPSKYEGQFLLLAFISLSMSILSSELFLKQQDKFFDNDLKYHATRKLLGFHEKNLYGEGIKIFDPPNECYEYLVRKESEMDDLRRKMNRVVGKRGYLAFILVILSFCSITLIYSALNILSSSIVFSIIMIIFLITYFFIRISKYIIICEEQVCEEIRERKEANARKINN